MDLVLQYFSNVQSKMTKTSLHSKLKLKSVSSLKKNKKKGNWKEFLLALISIIFFCSKH
jgi:hypothetical protein